MPREDSFLPLQLNPRSSKVFDFALLSKLHIRPLLARYLTIKMSPLSQGANTKSRASVSRRSPNRRSTTLRWGFACAMWKSYI